MSLKFITSKYTTHKQWKKKATSKATLHTAISPLWIFSSVIGIAPRLHSSKRPPPATIVFLIIGIGMCGAGSVSQTSSLTVRQLFAEPWLIPRLVMFLFERSVMTVALAVTCVKAQRNFHYIFKNMSFVDRCLYSPFDPPDYASMKSIAKIVTCSLIVAFLFFAAVFMWSVNVKLSTFPLYFLQRVTILINDVTIIQYICIVLLARSRFIRLSKIIGRSCRKDPSAKRGISCISNPTDKRVYHDMESIVRAYHSLCEVAETANANYGFQILLYVGFLSISIVSYLFKLIAYYRVNGSEENKIGLSAMWMTKNSLAFLALLAACHVTRDEAVESSQRITRRLLAFSAESRSETWRWGLVLAESRPTFNACGFFELDMSLLLHVGATATTYVIILLQN